MKSSELWPKWSCKKGLWWNEFGGFPATIDGRWLRVEYEELYPGAKVVNEVFFDEPPYIPPFYFRGSRNDYTRIVIKNAVQRIERMADQP